MLTVNIHEAKTHLSRLIEAVGRGESVIIARAGKPVARLGPVSAPEPKVMQRLGFLAGHAEVPDDFDQMGAEEIVAMFQGPT